MDPILTPDQIRSYFLEGWLSLPAISDEEELARLRVVYDDLFARRAGRDTGDQFDLAGDDADPTRARMPQILNPQRYAPELAETRLWRNAVRIAEALFGQAPHSFGAHAICKPAGSPQETPWHQDEPYWGGGYDYQGLSIWIPLQDVDAHSGCMSFIPRSHWGEILPHRPIGNDDRVHGLELDCPLPAEMAPVCVPLKAGGCTIHHARSLHYTGPNRAAVPRRALILMAGLQPAKRVVPKVQPWLDRQKTKRAQRAAAYATTHGDAPKPPTG